jgi:hypothetical protein
MAQTHAARKSGINCSAAADRLAGADGNTGAMLSRPDGLAGACLDGAEDAVARTGGSGGKRQAAGKRIGDPVCPYSFCIWTAAPFTMSGSDCHVRQI